MFDGGGHSLTVSFATKLSKNLSLLAFFDNTSEIHSDFVWWKIQVSGNILKSNKVTTLFIRTLKYVSNLHNWPWKYGLIFSRRFSYIGKWLEARIWLTFVVVVYNSRICSVAQYKQGKVLTERQNKWPQNLQTPTGNEIRTYKH